MPEFYSSNRPITSAFTALGQAMFPDPDKEAQARLYAAQVQKTQLESDALATAAEADARAYAGLQGGRPESLADILAAGIYNKNAQYLPQLYAAGQTMTPAGLQMDPVTRARLLQGGGIVPDWGKTEPGFGQQLAEDERTKTYAADQSYRGTVESARIHVGPEWFKATHPVVGGDSYWNGQYYPGTVKVGHDETAFVPGVPTPFYGSDVNTTGTPMGPGGAGAGGPFTDPNQKVVDAVNWMVTNHIWLTSQDEIAYRLAYGKLFQTPVGTQQDPQRGTIQLYAEPPGGLLKPEDIHQFVDPNLQRGGVMPQGMLPGVVNVPGMGAAPPVGGGGGGAPPISIGGGGGSPGSLPAPAPGPATPMSPPPAPQAGAVTAAPPPSITPPAAAAAPVVAAPPPAAPLPPGAPPAQAVPPAAAPAVAPPPTVAAPSISPPPAAPPAAAPGARPWPTGVQLTPEPQPVHPKSSVDLTQQQIQDSYYASQVYYNLKQMTGLVNQGFTPTLWTEMMQAAVEGASSGSMVGAVVKYLARSGMGPEARQWYTAAFATLEPLLRIATGAASPEQEVARYQQYLPNASDGPDEVRNKMARLKMMFDVLATTAAQSGMPMSQLLAITTGTPEQVNTARAKWFAEHPGSEANFTVNLPNALDLYNPSVHAPAATAGGGGGIKLSPADQALLDRARQMGQGQ